MKKFLPLLLTFIPALILSADELIIEGDLKVEGDVEIEESLSVLGDDGVVFLGAGPSGTFGNPTAGAGTIPVEGPGSRMIWYPSKAAFRVGQVNSGQWDSANIEFFSMAFGYRTQASGRSSMSWGDQNVASGSRATAWGRETLANGSVSTAWGTFTNAYGWNATATGHTTDAIGWASASFGHLTAAVGNNSMASGWGTEANGTNSFTAGRFTIAETENQFVIGRWNEPLVQTSGNLALFIVGKGTGSSSRANALEVWDNGDAKIAGELVVTGIESSGPIRTQPAGDIPMFNP